MKGLCVGLGTRGQRWYRWAQQAGLEVVGVVDLNDKVRQAACEKLNIPEPMCFRRVSEAAEATNARIATVCTANQTHAGVIGECLEAGLHTLVEKPMVQTPEEAKQVMAQAADKGLRLAVAQNYRFNTALRAIRKAVQDGVIGQVVTVDVAFSRWRPAGDMFLPLLLNQAIHQFDAVRAVLDGDPTWCFARSWNPIWSPSDGPTLLAAIWEINASGSGAANSEVIFSYSGNYVSHGVPTPYSGLWRIEGSTGRILYSGDEQPKPVLQRRETGEEILLPPMPGSERSETAVCRAFVEAIEANRPAPTDATDNIKSLSMCWAAEKSTAERRVVQMNEFF